MIENTDRETQLLAPENLPLDLDELSIVTEAELVMPGVYDAVLEQSETGLAIQVYIVLKNATELSDMAKKLGKPVPGCSGLLVYSEDEAGNTRYIISYELLRYRIIHRLPLTEDDNIRDTAAIGAEMYPGYFGNYPVPFLTPRGCTTRNKIITNGLYWLETEQGQRGLAVAYPKYDDLPDGARGPGQTSLTFNGTALLRFLRGCAGGRDQRERKATPKACSTGRRSGQSGIWGGPNKRVGISQRISPLIACMIYWKYFKALRLLD